MAGHSCELISAKINGRTGAKLPTIFLPRSSGASGGGVGEDKSDPLCGRIPKESSLPWASILDSLELSFINESVCQLTPCLQCTLGQPGNKVGDTSHLSLEAERC